jgi:MtrB/PioB family decaheme-associated outer membrane protein
MKTKTSLLIIYLSTSLLASGSVLAEDKPEEESEPLVSEEFISRPVLNVVELGVGYISDDAYRFGRYNGMQSQGAFVVGDIKIREFLEDGRFWSIRGTNLGLDSRYLRVEGGVQGSHEFFLEYDELPDYKNDTVETPFSGVGSNNLTLPSGFDINDMDDLNSFELKTRRERIKAGASFIPEEHWELGKDHWQFDIDFSHENKKGVDATGAAIANSSTQIVGNTTISLLPEPVDQDTDQVNATLSYDGSDGQVDLKYHMSIFDNNNDSLSWQDPFNPASATGSMSLAPDNEFHQLSLIGAYTLPYSSRLTGQISMGRMTQNQNFQPYTINPALNTDLPRDSLDGEVWLTNAQLKLASRPVNKLRLNAELRYSERDNQTPVETYDYVILDAVDATSVQNRPYSYRNNRFKLDANYRFNAITSLRGGYKYNEMKRDYSDIEREKTEENTLYAKWKIKAHATLDIALYGEASNRDGSEYQSLDTENPAMRKYNLADRDRTKIGTSIDYMATDKLFLGARADYNKDDYTDSDIGLTEATQPVYTVDISYQPAHNINTYGYYTYENIKSSQTGFDPSPGTEWQAEFEDTFDTIGIGASWTDLGKWDIGTDIVHSKSNGASEMTNLTDPGNADQYPDTKTELTSVKLWTKYRYSKQLSYKLGLWYEDYSADNWAIDDLQPYDPTVVANTLLLGNETLDYDVYVVTLSASYRY